MELWTDDQVVDWLVTELSTIFPDRKVPRPARIVRTRWRLDKFSRGSYVPRSRWPLGSRGGAGSELGAPFELPCGLRRWLPL